MEACFSFATAVIINGFSFPTWDLKLVRNLYVFLGKAETHDRLFNCHDLGKIRVKMFL